MWLMMVMCMGLWVRVCVVESLLKFLLMISICCCSLLGMILLLCYVLCVLCGFLVYGFLLVG